MSGFGYRINGRSAERVAVKQALADPADFVWVHLNTTEERAQIWLRDAAGLDDYVVDALTAMETRPRCEASPPTNRPAVMRSPRSASGRSRAMSIRSAAARSTRSMRSRRR